MSHGTYMSHVAHVSHGTSMSHVAHVSHDTYMSHVAHVSHSIYMSHVAHVSHGACMSHVAHVSYGTYMSHVAHVSHGTYESCDTSRRISHVTLLWASCRGYMWQSPYESCHTYVHASCYISHTWVMACESCHIYESFIRTCHVTTGHVTRADESLFARNSLPTAPHCNTLSKGCTQHESCHTCVSELRRPCVAMPIPIMSHFSHLAFRVTSHSSHVTRVNLNHVTRMHLNHDNHVIEWVLSHMRPSCGYMWQCSHESCHTFEHESCYTCEWMSHVEFQSEMQRLHVWTNESCHTCVSEVGGCPVGSLKSYVSFAEYRLFHMALSRKRPIILSEVRRLWMRQRSSQI